MSTTTSSDKSLKESDGGGSSSSSSLFRKRSSSGKDIFDESHEPAKFGSSAGTIDSKSTLWQMSSVNFR